MGNSVKKLAILGSTGSIGCQTLDVVRALPEQFIISALASGNNTALLAEQAAEFNPDHLCYSGDTDALSDYETLSIEEMAVHPDIDIVVIATSGKAGLQATLAAARTGKTIALSNKESLVMAGEIIMAEAKRSGAVILPVDSEHSAIWQCLKGETPPERIILTASGGPFKGYSTEQMADVTPEQALDHPSWKMGKKVTIDSATLMNKGLEIIEARWLFDIPVDRITVVIHPQSIIHSMVEFADGSVKAQMSYPDMKMPIQYALTWPERIANPQIVKIDWTTMKDLTFSPPDYRAFPCLRLATEAIDKGGTYPAALCAADETAVNLFLEGKIGFTRIAEVIETILNDHQPVYDPTIEDILETDRTTTENVYRIAGDINR